MLQKAIDINCDMGEGMPADEFIMPYINSANIACGFHAGGEALMRQTIDLAARYKVHIGAHPSFHDKANFGRVELQLPPDVIYALIIQQLVKIDLLVREKQLQLYHVKPHGALYNMAARDTIIANAIAQAVKDFREDLVLYGLSGSKLISEGKKLGLKTASEVFADRGYEEDGSLTPRSKEGALLTDEEEVIEHVVRMVNNGVVRTTSGKEIPIEAETICIHSDGKNALKLAKVLYQALHNKSNYTIEQGQSK